MPSINTYNTINGHVKNSSWTNDVEEPVDVLKNGNHHFIFIFGCRPGNEKEKKKTQTKNTSVQVEKKNMAITSSV